MTPPLNNAKVVSHIDTAKTQGLKKGKPESGRESKGATTPQLMIHVSHQ